jgi:predicted nucleotidyltransferase
MFILFVEISNYFQQMVFKEEIDLVSQIIQKFGATRIVLFGSCAYKSIEEANDIDILCYGVNPYQWLVMCRQIDLAVKSSVDVIDSNDIDEELRENWESYGKVLLMNVAN